MGEKKSVFEKLGLIEKVETTNSAAVDSSAIKPKKDLEKENYSAAQADRTGDLKPEPKAVETQDPLELIKNKKLLSVKDIYNKYNIQTDGINSLSIIESYMKALPVYLPADVKRDTTLNIVKSSGVDLDSLITDGNNKLKCLMDFAGISSRDADKMIEACEAEIAKLNEKINTFKNASTSMKKLLEEQLFLINYEIDRINALIEFIDPKK
jgi:hypothetical protein